MRLGGEARFMTEVKSQTEIAEIWQNAKTKNLPIFVLGSGSNVIAHDEGFDGVVLLIRISGFEIIDDTENSTTIRVGAGEIWDDVVARTVDMSLSGIEAMSGIPGTAGATAVQNVGAYGQEISDTLESLEAYDSETNKFVTLQNADCKFSYRDSIFRNEAKGRYVVTFLTLKLSKNSPQPPFYDSLQRYFDSHNIKNFDSKIIRDAVINIRKDKLPDPKVLPSAGSFFKNTIIEAWQANSLKDIDANIPMFQMANGNFKVPSGYLIEHAGLKGQLIHGMRVYDKNALVLVNESANSYTELAAAREEIVNKVRDTYGITIEQEPLEI